MLTSIRRFAAVCRWQRLRRYPELGLLAFSLSVVLVGRAFGLPLSPPDLRAGEAILHDYLLPLSITAMVHLVLLIRSRVRRGSSGVILALSIPTLFVVTYCHFQCKLWMPLVNPHRFDGVYYSIGHSVAGVVTLCVWLTRLMMRTGVSISAAYDGWFIALFFVCFGLHTLYDTTTGQRQVILGVGWILALGGICYWIAPAVGPFIFRHGASSNASFIQRYMWRNFNLLADTRRIPPGYFLAPPAAMPSLHIAHAAFFIWMLRRISRRLSYLFMPLLLWFMITSVGLAWHYVVDIPAGLLLAAVAVLLVTRMLPDQEPRKETEPLFAEHAPVKDLVPAE